MVIEEYQPASYVLHSMVVLEFVECRRYVGMDSAQDSIAMAANQHATLRPRNQECIAVAVGRLQVNLLRRL